MTFSLMVAAQNSGIQGVVTDADDKLPLIGVNVVIKGTTFGASTDFDGKYKIQNVPPGTYNVEVSYLGYEKKVFINSS